MGLSYSCLRSLSCLAPHLYPHHSLQGPFHSLSLWADTIQTSFEPHFWVGGPLGAEVEPHPELVHRTGMYKDSVASGQRYPDYQLRPNLCVTLALAPDLVRPDRAWAALRVVEEVLVGPLGLATLDPQDWAYRGEYDNSNAGQDPGVAHGANYHQGPEWLWPVGYYCRALLAVAARLGEGERREAARRVGEVAARLYTHLSTSAWLGQSVPPV